MKHGGKLMMFKKKNRKKTNFWEYKPELLHLEYKSSRALRNYFRFYRDEKKELALGMIFWLIKTTPDWFLPIVTANVINMISNPPDNMGRQLLIYALLAAVLLMQHTPSQALYCYFFSKANRTVEMKLRSSLCKRLQHLSIQYHKNNKMGVLHTKILRDVENVSGLTGNIMEGIPFFVFSVGIAIFMTASRAPKFLLFFLVMIPVVVLISRFAVKRIWAYNHELRISVEAMSGRVIEMLRMISVTRAHNVEQSEVKRVDEKFQVVTDSGRRLDMLNGIYSSVNMVTFTLFNVLTLITAGYLNYKGIMELGVGDVVLLTTYFNTISHMVLMILNLFPAIMRGLESVRSITDVLECADIEMNEGKPAIHSLKGHFRFDNVSFTYENEPNPAISDFSLDVKEGEVVAFVGPSGSGKSTIMQLLIGFMRPESGKVYVDGHDMNELDLRSYRRFISVVSQESVLFDGTIRENITYGVEHLSEEQIRNAIRCAGLEDFVATLPDGLETMCKENGNRFSGGQKQRMSIARALLRDPRVLLLDEATSALDVESEALIQNALDHLIKGRTTFIVAHRLSTIRNADRIVVLNHGKIAEIGTHEELLKLKGIYYRMTLLQSKEISNEEAAEIGKALEAL